MSDYYSELGVSRNATNEELRAAYRKRAKALHPDRPSGDAGKMADLNRAYETLSDPKRRLRYDQHRDDRPASSLDGAAQNKVMQLIMKWMEEDWPGSAINAVIAVLDSERSTLEAQRTQLLIKVQKIERKLGKLKRRDGQPSAMAEAIGRHLTLLKNQTLVIDGQLSDLDRAKQFAQEHEYEADTYTQNPTFFTIMT